MPTYDYVCDACGDQFELFQPITSAPLRKCPKCRKNSLRRLIGAGAGVIFKGSGFYQTDYRSDSYRKAAEKDKASPPSTPLADSTARWRPKSKRHWKRRPPLRNSKISSPCSLSTSTVQRSARSPTQ